MGPLFLFVTGSAIALLSLWQLRRWMAGAQEALEGPRENPALSSPLPSRPTPSTGKGPQGLAALQQEVAKLAGAGLSVTEIARRLGLTRAEVQLILGLRSSR